MKTQRNILIAFILNLSFSIFELIGGAITGSVAIISDAIHDAGDAMSIGISYFLEKKSTQAPDKSHTYGYARYSVLGGLITTVILIFGSCAVIYNAALRLFNPVEINYDGMIVFAVVGALVNLAAAFFTREGDSINQRAVNLHMLEDVLGWVVVLVGAIIMRFTDIAVIDPILSIGVAVFILINSVKNLGEVISLFLERTPDGVDLQRVTDAVLSVPGVLGVHHVHVRSIDGSSLYATMHVVAGSEHSAVKGAVRKKLAELGICHVTLELEDEGEVCSEEICTPPRSEGGSHHHHHHHHHHGHKHHGHKHHDHEHAHDHDHHDHEHCDHDHHGHEKE